MDMRTLGRTDLSVSSICLGTMTFGEQNTEADGHAQMDYAFEQGVNFLDIAELYPIPPMPDTQGRTEEIVGSWLKTRGNRDKAIIATKITGRSDMKWFRENDAPTRFSKTQILEAVDGSLKRLGTDYIDLYQLHWPDRSVSQFGSNPVIFGNLEQVDDESDFEVILQTMQELVIAGKIRHFGLSNESAWGTNEFLNTSKSTGTPRVVSVQNAYSLLNRTFETNMAELSLRENVGLLAYSPLGQGSLSGKYLNGALPVNARKTLFGRMQRYEKPGAEPAVKAYVSLARKFDLDPVNMALAFVLGKPFVTSVIIGATNMDQLKTAIASTQIQLNDTLLSAIDDIQLIHTNPCP
ncbi:MAG: aldo/keto reductase [Cohaesibacteraceae bacterium]|nr:aldo/keto reductase [Cohaesibacteraceae bacterium]